MNLRAVGYDGRDWINLAQDRDLWRAYSAMYAMEEERNLSAYPIISWPSCLMSDALMVSLVGSRPVFGQLTKQQYRKLAKDKAIKKRKFLIKLSRCPYWIYGETFKSAPKIMCPLYRIHANIRDEFLPLVLALMKDKTDQAYNEQSQVLLDEPQRFGAVLFPTRTSADNERVVMNAIRQTADSAADFKFALRMLSAAKQWYTQDRFDSC
ncbi:hypothetical protein ANN_11661 [Periplaneta americana]|uniref:Uncharacterized protein n=1 Tax=Periplaneta americana TaxID=6978 RepID=A0ABQ8T6D3_PERAM|nr:hypothetical protein ANN_11661 [Periplaneta americana]